MVGKYIIMGDDGSKSLEHATALLSQGYEVTYISAPASTDDITIKDLSGTEEDVTAPNLDSVLQTLDNHIRGIIIYETHHPEDMKTAREYVEQREVRDGTRIPILAVIDRVRKDEREQYSPEQLEDEEVHLETADYVIARNRLLEDLVIKYHGREIGEKLLHQGGIDEVAYPAINWNPQMGKEANAVTAAKAFSFDIYSFLSEHDPEVSVIVPAYKNQDMTVRAVRSLLNQETDRAYEVVVVDDGTNEPGHESGFSTNYDRLKAEFAQAVEEGKLKLLWKPNAQHGAARNRALKEARGKYVSYLDNDDIALPNFVESLATALDEDPSTSFVFAKHMSVDRDERILSHDLNPNGYWSMLWDQIRDGADPKEILRGRYHNGNIMCPINHNALMVRREVLDWIEEREGSVYDPHIFSPTDLDLWERVADYMDCTGQNFKFLDKYVVKYTWTRENMSANNPDMNDMQREVIAKKMQVRGMFGNDPNILIFTPRFEGGPGTVTWGQAVGLYREGVTNVTLVITPNWWYGKDVQEMRYNVLELTPEMAMFDRFDDYFASKGFSSLDDFLQEKALPFSSLAGALSRVNPKRFDLIGVHMNHYDVHTDAIKELGVPIEYIAHSLIEEATNATQQRVNLESNPELRQRMQSSLERRVEVENFLVDVQEKLMQSSDIIQVFSSGYSDDVSHLFPQLAERVVIVPNGGSRVADKNYLIDRSERPTNELDILSVGRIAGEKDHITAVMALDYLLAELAHEGRDVSKIRLRIVGTKDDLGTYETILHYIENGSAFSREMQRQGRPESLSEHVTLDTERFYSYSEIEHMLAETDLFVLPSIYEPWGLTLSDAVFHGVPVVTSDTDTVGGSIEHMRNGLMHKAGDGTDLKEKLRYALENPAQIDAMSEVARKEFEQRYTWDHVAKEIIEKILPKVMQRRETLESVGA